MVKSKEYNKIKQVKQVRNGLAHRWNESEIDYKGKPLSDYEHFKIFKQDLIDVLNILINKYIIEEEKNMEEIITTLSNVTENK
jgi:hypothetical protein